MAEQPQIIVQANVPPTKPFGARNDTNVRAAFADSPIYKNEITDQERKETYQDNALNGTVTNGNGINSFNLDFEGTTQDPVPNLEDVVTGGGGLPASPFVPNLASPGPGSVSAADQPVYNGEIKDPATNVEFGSGLGGTLSPDASSQRMSQATLGNYISGRSYQGSGG